MARVIYKFGGTSVGDTRRLYRAARRIAAAHRAGDEVVAVLSAQAGATDALLARGREIDPDCAGREADSLLSTGEQVSVSLCALALARLGVPAVSLCGWQMGLQTDGATAAPGCWACAATASSGSCGPGASCWQRAFRAWTPRGYHDARPRRFRYDGGRAGGLPARRSRRIYTDVDGVYDRDPRLHPDAVKYGRISYDDMLLLARGGARVLHDRCVELARREHVVLEVCSAFSDAPGTIVG